eukprot:GHVL01026083.1.p1 GENE.GHVL01026083.1~~GHVL01026083.1.p1  ORF type:complete len:321 (+),score=47.57 GHVL01026083.1:49-1011(+)
MNFLVFCLLIRCSFSRKESMHQLIQADPQSPGQQPPPPADQLSPPAGPQQQPTYLNHARIITEALDPLSLELIREALDQEKLKRYEDEIEKTKKFVLADGVFKKETNEERLRLQQQHILYLDRASQLVAEIVNNKEYKQDELLETAYYLCYQVLESPIARLSVLRISEFLIRIQSSFWGFDTYRLSKEDKKEKIDLMKQENNDLIKDNDFQQICNWAFMSPLDLGKSRIDNPRQFKKFKAVIFELATQNMMTFDEEKKEKKDVMDLIKNIMRKWDKKFDHLPYQAKLMMEIRSHSGTVSLKKALQSYEKSLGATVRYKDC